MNPKNPRSSQKPSRLIANWWPLPLILGFTLFLFSPFLIEIGGPMPESEKPSAFRQAGFIRLHTVYHEKVRPYYVRADAIVEIGPVPESGLNAWVSDTIGGMDGYDRVTETPEEVAALIVEALGACREEPE